MLQEADSAYRTITVTAQASGFGAEITGLDLAKPLAAARVLAGVKAAWARHGVVAFPAQPLSLDELEALTLQMGAFGKDPFIKPMPGRPNVLELRREPSEEGHPLPGPGWHSRLELPGAAAGRHDPAFRGDPSGGRRHALLRLRRGPPYEALSPTMEVRMLAPLKAVHSAARQSYGAAKGSFAKEDGGADHADHRLRRRPRRLADLTRWSAPIR